jgi:replication-associated recombination protein RarA
VVERGRVGSLVLWGPPGTGKTTLARVLAGVAEDEFVPLSAVTSGVKDLRGALDGARERLKFEDRGTLLFVDEVHRFNKAQQDALLPALEEGLVDFIGATTENPSSRSRRRCSPARACCGSGRYPKGTWGPCSTADWKSSASASRTPGASTC